MSRLTIASVGVVSGMDAFGPDAIVGFRGQYSWLSTWSRHPVCIDNVRYRTAEHAYQALKTDDPYCINTIIDTEHPKNLRRIITLGFNKEEGFRQVIRDKFSLSTPHLVHRLLSTGDRVLVCTDDMYRGIFVIFGEIRGRNMLGKIIMERREELKRQVQKIVVLQRRWKEVLVNPEYKICRMVRMRGFVELADELNKKMS